MGGVDSGKRDGIDIYNIEMINHMNELCMDRRCMNAEPSRLNDQ